MSCKSNEHKCVWCAAGMGLLQEPQEHPPAGKLVCHLLIAITARHRPSTKHAWAAGQQQPHSRRCGRDDSSWRSKQYSRQHARQSTFGVR